MARWCLLYLWWFIDERNHALGTMDAATYGQQGGFFSTSMMEASLCLCWSSTPPHSQVIRSRRFGGGQRRWFFAGRRISSDLSQFLGGDASRMPASGGGEAPGPDCFSKFCSGVCFVNLQALSSNIRFFRASVVRGLFENFTSHVSL